ncbi:proliferating cell nuclear antigen, C-terminal domain-containing protein [Chytridium lagenaria]|nr:proliferating cell nuclear antigen, C-terminal domain-containing protein [Chytridium lagenaria]
MLEATIEQAITLKKAIDAVKELVTDANFDCQESGISLQAMDNSHVALVSLLLRSSAFHPFRCDHQFSIGINLNSLTKILKCANNDDTVTIRGDSGLDTLTLVFDSKKGDRTSEYQLKLMTIDSEHLGIPDTEYDANVQMSSAEFQRICRDLSVLGDSVTIDVTKDGVKFSSSGDVGNGQVYLRNETSIDSESETATKIAMTKPVSLMFALKYLNNFTKATPLSDKVTISMSDEVPVLIEYEVGDVGYVRYYLAPKITDAE